MSVGSVNIIREGLILCLDGENLKSYPGSGDNWYDLTSNSNNGLLTNGATFSTSGNGSIQFDGVNDYISCGNSSTFQINTATLCVWMKTTNPGNGYRAIITKQSNYGLFLLDGVLITYDWGDGTYGTARSTGTNLTDGKWYHVVLSFTNNIMSPSNNADIYINGVNVLTTTIEYKNDSQEVQIVSGGSIGGSQYLNGNIASVQIYNRALTSSEVLHNYNSIKWRFMNELTSIVTDQLYLNLDSANILSYPGSGTTWYDLTVNSHNATLTNGAYYDSSDSGVIVFDGVDDYANVGNLGSGFGIFTLDMWFNSGSVTDYKNIIDFNGGNTMLRIEQYTSPGYQANWANIGPSTRARMAVSINPTTGFGFGGDGPVTIIENTWYNLVVTFDGNYCSIYINNQKLVNNYLVTGGFVGYINNMRIGDGYDYSSRRFQGKIPVVRLYKKSLSDSEVLQNYNVQKSRYGL